MKLKSFMSTNTNGNAGHLVGLLKRNSVLKCPPVRKLPDAFVTYHLQCTYYIILGFVIFVFDIIELKVKSELKC